MRRRASLLDWQLRRYTARWRALPDFLIIGAMRAGTTSLINYLYQHPRIRRPWLSQTREIQFFDVQYQRGEHWYRTHFPLGGPHVSPDSRNWRTGASSPYCLFHPHAARRASTMLPQAKIIVLLRDPIERTISHYQYLLENGWIPERDFEQALDVEKRLLPGEMEKLAADEHHPINIHRTYCFIERSKYFYQLRTWQQYFPDEQILCVRSEDLFSDPQRVMPRVFDFLEIEPSRKITYTPHNGTHRDDIPDSTRNRLQAELEGPTRDLEREFGIEPWW